MSTAWLTVVLLAAGTIAIKAAGPVLLGGRPLPATLGAVVGLLAPSLLAALVVVETLAGHDRALVVDARLAGLLAAAATLALRLPVLVVVLAAAVATASARALL